MSGGTWNRCGRWSGGSPQFVFATDADDIVQALIAEVVEIEAERGIKIDWMAKLPPRAAYTSRDVVNAIGLALTEAGEPNNLFREVTA